MGLGEIYQPKGFALKTARAILEVEDPWAVNVALGCPGGCGYCYGPRAFRKPEWTKPRYPKKTPYQLVKHQLEKGISPEGVFASFATDPFHKNVRQNTRDLMDYLTFKHIRTATLTKLTSSTLNEGHRYGITVVSIDRKFWKTWELNTDEPMHRIQDLQIMDTFDDYCWGSMEPVPPPAIYKQDFYKVLEELKFMKFLIFGKWNYDKRADTDEAREYYIDEIDTFRDFCEGNSIRWHVKSKTLKFCELENDPLFQGHGGTIS